MNKSFIAAMVLLAALPAALQAQTVDADNPASETSTEVQSEEQAYQAWAEQFLNSLDPQTGTIELPGGIASLEVPDSFYYLSPEDAKKVLEDAWGNPPSELGLGMLFPSAYTPLDGDSWGVTIDFEQQGYVSDEDAADIDYNDLLAEMQADTREESKYRVEQGFETLELVGWAAQPYYDANTHKLYWAKELRFGDMEQNTLNYNVRALGRRGVLVMNFIASMPQLPEIEASRDQVLAMATFNDGHRYSQFNPDIDEVAAYGIGGLIAGKVLAKTGFLAIALVFLKKFWFVLLLPLLWLKNLVFKKKTA
ncbi:DUF2167 domain-containing protein [Simiduia agarivorans]|uniref:DUF2167 domain-containing protein n=1 Tax=Simiduia agarivorans (strain DSM 21679 / JCM 13881 / BCRC 17597 / SA1) TaxID=1117647 RepID=K4KLU3_SIMAS|nr:DUF2167 domain-containing protein [Simiduia agarivorans]AFU99048.1 hypothetical protein M5M_09315 [Simiduia agarivorans SA1 = DSM 21679]